MTDIKYDHKLQEICGMVFCSCNEFSCSPGDTEAMMAHFTATTTEAVKDQTGWRGLWNRIRGRT